MNTSLYIARRLALSGSGSKQSPALRVAVISTALSIAVMLLSISVVRGFREQIRDKITGFDAHISLYPSVQYEEDSPVVEYTPELKEFLDSRPYINRADLILAAPVLLKTPQSFKGLYIRGVEPDYDFSFLQKNLTQGTVPAPGHKYEVLISSASADKLGVGSGDSINLFMADDMKARKVKVAGVFNTHFDSYDQFFTFGPSSLVRELTGLDTLQGSAIDITTADFAQLRQNNRQLISDLNAAIRSGKVNQNFQSLTALDKGGHYFAWLDLLDVNVWVILSLMSAVAVFTLISGMLVIIMERIRFIGVMRSIGATRRQIRDVFILLAIRIGLRGMLWGGGAALLLIVLQKYTRFIPLDPDAYYIDFVPVSLEPLPFLGVFAGFTLITWLALILPSQFAGRIKPVETLRFES